MENEQIYQQPVSEGQIQCPNCGSYSVEVQVHQETAGTTSVSRTQTEFYEKKKHGVLYKIFILPFVWLLEIALFPITIPVLIIRKKKKNRLSATSTGLEHSHNHIRYNSVCICKNCGHNWSVDYNKQKGKRKKK